MAQLDYFRLVVNVLALFKFLIAIGIVVVGGFFAGNIPIRQAYGNSFLGMGIALVFIGLFSMASAVPLVYGIKRHNRAVIAGSFMFDVAALFIFILISVVSYTPTTPIFSKSLQDNCLYTYGSYTDGQCASYLESDRTAGFRLAWNTFYSHQGTYYSTITKLEDQKGCCGFGPPYRCRNDTRAFPSGRPLTGLPGSLSKQRLLCGHFASFSPRREWYTAQTDCTTYYDAVSIPPIVGGCEYDLGIGPCVTYAIDGDSKGCASAVEDYIAGIVRPGALFIATASAFHFACALLCAIMFFKRKHFDVFPALDEQVVVSTIVYYSPSIHSQNFFVILLIYLTAS